MAGSLHNPHKRALVAGGAGFLGSHLCDSLLQQNCEVVCVDSLLTGSRANIDHLSSNPAFRFIRADVVDGTDWGLNGSGFDEIYNLACAASPPAYQRDPEHTLLTSVIGTRNLLQMAERYGARFLLTSTSEIYGEPLEHPQRETYRGNVNPIGPRACYDEGKRAAETLAFDYARADRVEVRVVRIFNTYGPRLNPLDGRVVSNFIVQALEGKPLTLFGNGEQTRSFCYVDDLIRGILAMMRLDQDPGGPVNLGNPHEITVRELAERVSQLTGAQLKITAHPLPTDDPARRRPDIAMAQALLDWQPRISLDQGLRSTIDWLSCRTAADAVNEPLVVAQ